VTADHIEVGRKGEELAAEFLRQKSYRILERNWRHSRCEVDIIASNGDGLVIVEVKSRTSDEFGTPEESVDADKRDMLIAAANAYSEQTGADVPLRFDIIAVDLSDKRPEIVHFEDAFYPVG